MYNKNAAIHSSQLVMCTAKPIEYKKTMNNAYYNKNIRNLPKIGSYYCTAQSGASTGAVNSDGSESTLSLGLNPV